MKFDAQNYLDTARDSARVMYRDCLPQDRLAFHVGILEGYIMQMCKIMNTDQELIDNLESQIKLLELEKIAKDNA